MSIYGTWLDFDEETPGVRGPIAYQDSHIMPSDLPGMWDAADLEGGWADMGLPSFAAFNNHVAPRTGAASTALKPPEAANVDALGPSPQDGASTAEPPPGALVARPGAVPRPDLPPAP